MRAKAFVAMLEQHDLVVPSIKPGGGFKAFSPYEVAAQRTSDAILDVINGALVLDVTGETDELKQAYNNLRRCVSEYSGPSYLQSFVASENQKGIDSLGSASEQLMQDARAGLRSNSALKPGTRSIVNTCYQIAIELAKAMQSSLRQWPPTQTAFASTSLNGYVDLVGTEINRLN
jgi:hypothetical protein